jgi:hypothetical protein
MIDVLALDDATILTIRPLERGDGGVCASCSHG